MKENLFYCDTSYQLFTAINLALQLIKKNESVDLIIYHQFNSSWKYSERLHELKIFARIYDINPPSKHRIKDEVFEMIFCKAYLRKCCQYQEKRYNSFYCATMDSSSAIAAYVVSKAKHLVLYDDGLGSYIGHIIYDYMSNKRLRLLRVTHPFSKFFPVEKIMLYHPEVSVSSIRKREKMEFKVDEQIEKVFGYTVNTMYENGIIFLDQPLSKKTQSVEDSFQVLSKLMNKYFGNDYIARLHPRLKESNLETKRLDMICNMWELECINQITDTCIIITVFSTAAIQPIMISNKRPTVVFLYHLFQDALGNKMVAQLDEYLQKINVFIDDANIYVPSSWKEVEELFSRVGEI